MDIKTVIQLMVSGNLETQVAIKLIADEFDVDINALEGSLKKAFTMGYKGNARTYRFTDVEIETVVRLWIAGSTKGQIAKELGRDRTSITNLISRLRRQGVALPLRPLEHLSKNNQQLTLF